MNANKATSERWHNIPSQLTEALATLTSALQKHSIRLDHIDSDASRSSTASAQLSEQLREVAAAVERLTVAVGAGERQTRVDIKDIWSEIENRVTALRSTAGEGDNVWRCEIQQRLTQLEIKCSQDSPALDRNRPVELSSVRGMCLELEAAVSELQSAVGCRPTRSEMEAAYSRKATWADVEALVNEKIDHRTLGEALTLKAEASVVESLAAKISSQMLTREHARQIVRSELAPLSSLLSQCDKECRNLRRDLAALEGRRDADDGDGGSCKTTGDMLASDGGTSPHSVSPRFRRGGHAADQSWVKELAKAVTQEMIDDAARKHRADTVEKMLEFEKRVLADCEVLVERRSRELLREVEKRVDSARTRAEKASAELVGVLNSKSYKSDVAKALRTKADAEAVEAHRFCLESHKAEVGQALCTKAEAHSVESLRVKVEAESAETRSALSRTAKSLHGLLTDLTSFKTDIQQSFESVQGSSAQVGTRGEDAAAASSKSQAEAEQRLRKEWEAQRAALSAGMASLQSQVAGKVEQAVLVKVLEESSATILGEAEKRCERGWDASLQAALASHQEQQAQTRLELETLRSAVEKQRAANEKTKSVGDDGGVVEGAGAKLGASLKALEGKVVEVAIKVAKGGAGRWLWRSGNATKGNCVPWEAQAANPNPDIFVWRPDSTTITTTVPGLYHLILGFFTSIPATIQVSVNGEPILTRCPVSPPALSNGSTVRSSREVGGHSPTGEASYVVRRGRHSVGDVTSVGMDEYVALPASARLSVRFESTERAQGFLSLKKL